MDAGYVDEFGYVYVTARDDDVINVAGHRLSTAALEDVVLAHPDIADATVVGVPEPTKGDIPLCLFVTKRSKHLHKQFKIRILIKLTFYVDVKKNDALIIRDLIGMVRELVGPIAAFKLAASVKGLPRTRSGKICRKSISDLARNKSVKVNTY